MTDIQTQLQENRANNFKEPSIMRRILAAVAGETFRKNYAFGVDVSQYQQVIDWPTLKAGGVKFVFIRGSYGSDAAGHGGSVDPYVAKHIQGAYDADIPAAIYHALDPGYYVYKLQSLTKLQQIDTYLPVAKDEQIQTLLKAVANKTYYALAIDFELFKDWNGGTITDGWLAEVAFQFLVRVRKVLPGIPIYFYTGSWFIWTYCKSLETTGRLNNLAQLWTAYYPQKAGVQAITWEQLLSVYPPDTMTINGRSTQNPPYLGFPDWKFWQFSGDKYTLPGITDLNGNPSAMDLNLFKGEVESLYLEWKFVPKGTTPPPGPDDPPAPDTDLEKRVGALEAWAKSVPKF